MDTINQMNNQMNGQMNSPMSQPEMPSRSKGSGLRIAIAVIVIALVVIAAVFVYGNMSGDTAAPVNDQAAIAPAQQQQAIIPEPSTADLQADLDSATQIDNAADLKAIDSQF